MSRAGAAPVLGLDFGTNRAGAALILDGEPVVIPAVSTAVGFPAAVSAGAVGSVLATGAARAGADGPAMGEAADRLSVTHPERVVTAVKRLLGRKFDAPEVRRHRQDVAYEVVAARNGDARIRVGRRQYGPPEIAAFVLERLKAEAEARLGSPVSDVALTVPVLFHDLQRQALRDAARIAGLKVAGMLTEPAAVVLGAGLDVGRGERKVIVCDLGAGSFDVAAVLASAGEVELVASGGDAFLGGEDFDQRIVGYVCDEIGARTGIDLRRDARNVARLKREAERVRCELSRAESTVFDIAVNVAAESDGDGHAGAATPDGGAPWEHPASGSAIRLVVSRARLEGMLEDLVNRTVWSCEAVLRDAGWAAEDLAAVLLVGGAGATPLVRRHLGELFGKEPTAVSDADGVIALGAARYGAALSGKARGGVAVVQATTVSLGIEAAGGVFARVIPRGSPLPAEHVHVFGTNADGQTQLSVHLLQGEREMAADNESIAHLVIGPLPSRPRGEVQVEVTIETDGTGLPRARARDVATGQARAVRVRPSGGLGEAELAALVASHAGNASGGPVVTGGEVRAVPVEKTARLSAAAASPSASTPTPSPSSVSTSSSRSPSGG